MSIELGFVGLGVMGLPMAGHLAEAGNTVTVFDIDPSRAEALAAAHPKVRLASSAADVASMSEIVVTMLPSGESVQSAALGDDGLIHGFSGGELVIDTSSCEPWLTIETGERLADRGVAMIDAPTSGAEIGAKSATLVFMVGGEEGDVLRGRNLLDAMGERTFHVGPLGAGHSLKSINNLITAMILLATAEGLALGTKLGLDPDVMTDVLNVSTGMSWITQTHIKQRIINRAFDDPFKLDLMVKDIRIALELADRERLRLAFCKSGQTLWREAQDLAADGASVSELVRWVERVTGVEIRV